MGKQRREQPPDSIFGNNPFGDGFLEWMGSREGQQCIEIHDVLWDLLEDVQLDAKQRQLIWPDAKRTARKQRLDLDQSVQRIQKLHSDFPRDEVEEFLLDWIMGYDPENYSRANSTNSTSLQRSGLPTISGRLWVVETINGYTLRHIPDFRLEFVNCVKDVLNSLACPPT